jgi:hypothetical protein
LAPRRRQETTFKEKHNVELATALDVTPGTSVDRISAAAYARMRRPPANHADAFAGDSLVI